jgi:hypothetical protein
MKLPAALPLLLLIATTGTACQREQAAPPTQDKAALPPLAEGAEMTYACEDTEMRVVYADGKARVTLADGLEFALPRSRQTSQPGEEFYVGEGRMLRRQGSVVELRQQGSGVLQCIESSATA